MDFTQMTLRQIWDDFNSEVCSACGGRKRKLNSFCRNCYHMLPARMKHALYQRFGEGYEEAFKAAKQWFSETATTLS